MHASQPIQSQPASSLQRHHVPDRNPMTPASSGLPFTHASYLIPAIKRQAALEFRAHDGLPGAAQALTAAPNRRERLCVARAIAHAAAALRAEDGLSNDVVNLVHEANRLIAQRPIPPRRRRVAVERLVAWLARFGADPARFSTDEPAAPNLRLRLDFKAYNTDNPYPDVLAIPDNLILTTEKESATLPPVESPAPVPAPVPAPAPAPVLTPAPGHASPVNGTSSAGSGLRAALNNLPAKAAAFASAILFVLFLQSPPFRGVTDTSFTPAKESAGAQPQTPQYPKAAPTAAIIYKQDRPWLGDHLAVAPLPTGKDNENSDFNAEHDQRGLRDIGLLAQGGFRLEDGTPIPHKICVHILTNLWGPYFEMLSRESAVFPAHLFACAFP